MVKLPEAVPLLTVPEATPSKYMLFGNVLLSLPQHTNQLVVLPAAGPVAMKFEL